VESKILAGIAAAAPLSAATVSQAALISYYNFSNLPSVNAASPATNGMTSISPTSGSGSLSLSNFGGNVDDVAGTTVNEATPTDSSSRALNLVAGSGSAGNNTSITFNFSMSGRANPILSFATRRPASGFNSNTLSYSTNGTSFTAFGSAYDPPNSTTFSTITFDLTSVNALDNVPTAYLRLTFSGASSTSGTNGIDNVQVNAIPEPASLAALGGLAVLGLRRSRR
jgi:hypothetical protein